MADFNQYVKVFLLSSSYWQLMKKSYLAGILIAVAILVVGATAYILLRDTSSNEPAQSLYTYEIINAYPHDENAFTEGLVFEKGTLFEGTGLYGESKLLKTLLETGTITQSYSLPETFFGEGITILDNKVFQLTWREKTGFVYDKDSFQLLRNFTYATEGWGLTTDGEKLIMSNGSATLQFLDPETFQIMGTVEVHDLAEPVSQLNELEYVKGDVYANIFEQKRIAIINIQTGQVKGWIDLNDLHDPNDGDLENVLNGIAYDSADGRLFVTGKRWTQLFEIKIAPVK